MSERRLPNAEFCRTRPIAMSTASDCLVDSPDTCQYAFRFGYGHMCRHPDHLKFGTRERATACPAHLGRNAPMPLIIAEILQYIEETEPVNYKEWTVGIMQEIEACYCEHGRPPTFNFWAAHSFSEARAIKRFFREDLGMQHHDRPNLLPHKPTWIYVFRTPGKKET